MISQRPVKTRAKSRFAVSTSKSCSCSDRPGFFGAKRRAIADLLEDVEDILGRLNQATTPQTLNLPGYRLHPLKGELRGFWSVTVRANWRIIFRFQGEDACDVELIDYH